MLYENAKDEKEQRQMELKLYAPPRGVRVTRRRVATSEASSVLAAVRAEEMQMNERFGK